MPSDLQVSNIRDLTNANSAISIASDGQVTIAQNNPTIQLGSNTTFPTGTITNYIAQTTTISGSQHLSTTYTTVTGSLISSYTPTTGADKVFYSVNLRMSHDGDTRGIPLFLPFLDGSALNQKQGFAMDTNVGQSSFGDLIYYHTIIDASGWTSGKNVELKAREYSGIYQVKLHTNGNFFDTSGNESVVYNNVHAVIYSIM